MDIQLLEEGLPGPIGVGLWRSGLKQIPTPPWAPRRDFASLTGGKSITGWRNLWVLGGDAGKPMNDIWRSVDGGGRWEMVISGPHWCARSRLAVCGAASDPKQGTKNQPIGIMYVIGGQAHTGLCADVWASDTAGRSWHRMTEQAAFGPRADVACAVVPPDPLALVVAGGVSVDMHRDLWLSRDAGETFSEVTVPLLPPFVTIVPWPPDLLCAAKSQFEGRLALWKLKLDRISDDDRTAGGLTTTASLESLDDELSNDYDPNMGSQMLRPPRISLDVELQVALSWDGRASCLVVQTLGSGETRNYSLQDVSAAMANDVHILCDMDAANLGWEFMRHGRIWILSGDGSGAWATDRKRFRAQEQFVKLLGMRLAETHGIPWELWIGRVRPLLLPFRAQQAGKATIKKRSGLSLGTWRVVHKPRVAVRNAPSVSADIVAVEQSGSMIKPLEVGEAWLRVSSAGKVGWMLIDGSLLGLGRLLERTD
ncbi:unnamed protein product [Polarella glacialis]|uniref:Uncharacterized protein n=1 Tax=Polarella glacialis TaxID=89957 RepID=A0A813I7D7_POLGL|nr:unnamed protein product [Polarella glacialis]